MRTLVIAGLALWAAFAAFAGKAHAEINYPWCIIGDSRGLDCVFTSREQCAQDGRNRGFGGQCVQNPAYKPGAPTVSGEKRTVSQSTRPSQAVGRAHQTECKTVITCDGRGSALPCQPRRECSR
jgi:hypothetical protein